jgi:hypothetical protein
MKKALTLGGLFFLTVALIALIGCSEEKTTEPRPGDPSDPDFQMISDFVNEDFVEHDLDLLSIALALVDSIPDLPAGKIAPALALSAPDVVFSQLSYSYSDYWHIFELTAIVAEEPDSLYVAGIDSLRFNGAAGPMQYPDSTTTSINVRCHVDAEFTGEGAEVHVSNDAAFILTGEYDSDEFTLNGNSADSIMIAAEGEGTICEGCMATNQTINNVYFDSLTLYEDGCPPNGSVNVLASLDMSCANDSASFDVDANWTVIYTFNGENITMSYNNGLSTWVVTVPCGSEGGGTAKRGWLSAARRLTER